MAKKVIRLTESEFKKFLAESVMYLKEQELGLDNLPDTDSVEGDEYDFDGNDYGFGNDNMSQSDRWDDYDNAEQEHEVDMLNGHPHLYDNVDGYDEYDDWQNLDNADSEFEDGDFEDGFNDEMIAEAIRHAFKKLLK